LTTLRLFIGRDPDPEMATPNSLLKGWFMHQHEGLRTNLEFVASAGEADAVVVPMEWRSYETDDRLAEPWALANAAEDARKPFVVFSHTDLEPKLPFKQSTVLFRSGATRGRQPSHVRVVVVPAFVGAQFLDANDVPRPSLPPRRPKPVVGFCGGAHTPHGFARQPRNLAEFAVLRARHVAGGRFRRYYGPELTAPRTYRGEVLEALARDDRIEANFVIRNAFRAGAAKDESPEHPAITSYRDNLESSDYALVLRGKGNFSIRLSEVLRFGRIPLHIDTNDVLPYDQQLDWKALMVSVPAAKLGEAGARVQAHFESHTDGELAALQMRLYEIWNDRFTRQGFVNHFPECLNAAIAR